MGISQNNTAFQNQGFTLLILVMLTGCEQCAPGLVAQGVSQLTIRNFGVIAQSIAADTRCGFDSQRVKNSPVLLGEVGSQGVLRYEVKNCKLRFTREAPYSSEDCRGTVTAAVGEVEVTATQTIHGYLTGDPKEPVIPNGPDAVQFEILSAKFNQFQVDSTSGPEFLVMQTGEISGRLFPRLAASADRGVCSIPSNDIRIEEVVYKDASLRVVASGRDFIVPVATSNLRAVHGRVGEEENTLVGEIQVWNSLRTVPNSSGDRALDPEYSRAKHKESFACTDNLRLPVGFDECVNTVQPMIAQGASQLAIQTIGNLANLLDEDTRCGFASEAVLEDVEIEGEQGLRGGRGTWTVRQPCEFDFPQPTTIRTDCHGVETVVQGKVVLTGKKVLTGIPSGDRAEPIVPTSWEPANVKVRGDFTDFAMWTTGEGGHRLDVLSGSLSATIQARVAKDIVTGACSKKTLVTHFSEVSYRDADIKVKSEGRTFSVFAESSTLTAQNGARNGLENHLSGYIVIDDEEFQIPTKGEALLDPGYEENRFTQSFTSCDTELEMVGSSDECEMYDVLGEGLGRLAVMSVGALAGLVNSDSDCGFENLWVLLRPDEVQGDPGQSGLMRWSISDCAISRGPNSAPYETDCLGRRKFMRGTATIDATRTVTGLREKKINIGSVSIIDSIVPDSHQSVDLVLQNVELDDVYIFELNPGETKPNRSIHIHSGRLTALVAPITGEKRSSPGAFDIATSIAEIERVRLRDADVTIVSEGKSFRLYVADTEIDAFNGSYHRARQTNAIVGQVTVDGETIFYPPSSSLDPDYNQRDFDARYECTDDLMRTITPE